MTKIFKVYVVLLILTTTTLFAQEKTIFGSVTECML
jgi:hypothetical protein